MLRSHRLYISLISMWLALTCFVDFVAVPHVFRNVSSREEAGNVGMIIFSLVNKVEFIFVIAILVCAFLFRSMVKKKLLMFGTIISLLILVTIYNVHMTPQVSKQTYIMREYNEDDPRYIQAAQTHHFYHSLYRKTDGAKILTLLILLGLAVGKRQKEIS